MPELNLHVVQRHINEIISRKRSGEAHPALSDSVIEALAELAECELQRRKELTSAAPTLADSPLQADIDARIAELEEQLKKEIGAQASMQAEIDRLRVTEAAYRNHLCPPRSAADTQLQADIEALTQRVSDLEFASSPGYYTPHSLTDSQLQRITAFNAAVKELIATEIDKSMRIGGAINRALR